MNKQAVKTEIERIVNQQRYILPTAVIRHQGPVSEAQIVKLTELGIIDLMPANYGAVDAEGVIVIAGIDGSKEINSFSSYSAGIVPGQPSALYVLLHTELSDDASPIVKYLRSVDWAPRATVVATVNPVVATVNSVKSESEIRFLNSLSREEKEDFGLGAYLGGEWTEWV